MLAAVGRNVVLWEAARKRRVASAHPFPHPSHIDFSPDGKRLAVKSTTGEIVVLGVPELEVVACLGGTEFGEGSQLFFTEDGNDIIHSSWAGDLVLRSAETGVVRRQHRVEAGIGELCLSADRRLLACSLRAETPLRLLQPPFAPGTDRELSAISGGASALAIDHASSRLAAAVGGELLVCAVDDGRPIGRHPILRGGVAAELAWSADGQQLFLASNDKLIAWADDEELWHSDVPYACSVAVSQCRPRERR
jgi:dipeptidyl aminopeptidase/acylaminoacyl peptidase